VKQTTKNWKEYSTQVENEHETVVTWTHATVTHTDDFGGVH